MRAMRHRSRSPAIDRVKPCEWKVLCCGRLAQHGSSCHRRRRPLRRRCCTVQLSARTGDPAPSGERISSAAVSASSGGRLGMGSRREVGTARIISGAAGENSCCARCRPSHVHAKPLFLAILEVGVQLTGPARVQGATAAHQLLPPMRHALLRQQAAPFPGQVQQQLPVLPPNQWPQTFPQTLHRHSDTEAVAEAAGVPRPEAERRGAATQPSAGSALPRWGEERLPAQVLPQSPAAASLHSPVTGGLERSPAPPGPDEHPQASGGGAQQEAMSILRQGAGAWQASGLLPKPGQPRLWRQASPPIDVVAQRPTGGSPGELPASAAAPETTAGSDPAAGPTQRDSGSPSAGGSPPLQSPGTPRRQAAHASPTRSASQQRSPDMQAASGDEHHECSLPQQSEHGAGGVTAPDAGGGHQAEEAEPGGHASSAALPSGMGYGQGWRRPEGQFRAMIQPGLSLGFSQMLATLICIWRDKSRGCRGHPSPHVFIHPAHPVERSSGPCSVVFLL